MAGFVIEFFIGPSAYMNERFFKFNRMCVPVKIVERQALTQLRLGCTMFKAIGLYCALLK